MAQLEILARLGRHSAVTIQGQVYDASGNLTAAGISYNLTGKLNAFTIRQSPNKENIGPVTRPYANMVITEDSCSVEIEEVASIGRNMTNVLPLLAAQYDIIGITAVLGYNSGGEVDTWNFVGSRGELDDGVTSKGKNTIRLSLDQIDIGVANPTYTVS